MDRHDFDRDGQVDLMFTTIEVKFLRNNLYRKFQGFMGGSVNLYAEFFRMERGRYAARPNATRRIGLQHPGQHRGPGWVPLDLALRGGRHEDRITRERHRNSFNRPILLGDVTGDGRSDLLLGLDKRSIPGLRHHPDDLFRVYVGVPGPDLFSPQYEDVVVPVPTDDEYARLADLDKDGRQDILLHYPSTTDPSRLTILISR
jgi:hypothetical protein